MGRRGEIGLVEMDLALIERHQPDNHVEAGGLAGAVRPEQSDDFTAFDRQRHVTHYLAPLVLLA